MTIVNSLNLETFTLAKGSHLTPDEGMCLLEAASYIAGEPFSDAPRCTSEILGIFGRQLNDVLDDERLQLSAVDLYRAMVHA